MLYVVTLTYIRPMDDVNAHLDSHREWLAKNLKAGTIIAAGPMEPAIGGIVLAHCANREELDAMLKTDSFCIQNLVEYDVRCFKPALGAEAFAEALTLKAKLI